MKQKQIEKEDIFIRKIDVKIIPHREQRYETVGDWFYNPANRTLWIRVSDLGDWRYNFLVAFHEQAEAVLCIHREVNEKDVTAFDIAYEVERKKGNPKNQGEPGDHYLAPYRKEHFFATSVERLMAAELGVNWEEYDKAVSSL